jgi:predicted Rossmann fold nucleotide-binding protein DprA/Smf involved in DNA uptake
MNPAIVGSRGFTDSKVIRDAILDFQRTHYSDRPLTIVSGGARGADSLGAFWARELSIPTIIHLPDWDRFGKSAGYRRNELIVRDADYVLAFFAPGPRSNGTQHTVDIARAAGKTVRIYHEGVWS